MLSLIKDISSKYPQYGSYLEISRNHFKITNKYCAVRILEPEGTILPKNRINHFSFPSFRSKITFNLWEKDLEHYDVFQKMRIFNEEEIIRRIRIMKTSGLKFTKAKFMSDLNQVEQNSKF